MKNYIIRIISEQANVIGLACVTTVLVNESCRLHGAYPTACTALGRALTGGTLMASLLKMGQRLALKFEGNGPLKKSIVEADYEGNIRGFVAVPEVDLPPSDENMIDRLIENIRKLPPYTQMLRAGQVPESILEAIFSGIPYVILEKQELFYRCTCSRERIEKVLVSLGREKLADMIEKQGKADVTCEFCRNSYQLGRHELEALLDSLRDQSKP
jgi:molecular chaperone Hsp33